LSFFLSSSSLRHSANCSKSFAYCSSCSLVMVLTFRVSVNTIKTCA
jgi:hypothetical protein